MIKSLDYSAFGKNDIRGIYGEDITEELFYYVGKGYVKYVEEMSNLKPKDIWITVSRDARLHSESLTKVLIKGITHMGANAINLDVVPTPLGYYSEFASYPETISNNVKISGALIVTASHNPPEYNGLKLTYNKATLGENEIKKVKEYTIEQMNNDLTSVKHGESRLYNIITQYTESMLTKFGRIGNGIKVVVDSANGTAGVVAPKLYSDLGCEVIELYSKPDGNFPNHHPNPSDLTTLKDKVEAIGLRTCAEKLGLGEETLKDIIDELMRPGRDPRDELPAVMLRSDVLDIKDLKEGMQIKGTVRNVIDFGAFVDIGVHQDGLLHISQISDKYIKHPSEVLKVGDIINVKILSVDLKKNRISLTLK